MWAQSWTNLFSFTVPYTGKQSVDITESLKYQKYTPLKMFKLADDFFQSLGLTAMPQPFWDESMIVQPLNKSVVCHGSAWDFYNRKDYRIKMCTEVNMVDLVTIHHEMGHVEYFMQYAPQPVSFRDGANPGFHEAIGDTIALSVSTPAHLKTVQLLHEYREDKEQDLNYLFHQALDKIAFLPFGYLIDLWRWNVFNESYSYEDWNPNWWNLRFKYQGVVPPVSRGTTDFDPGAKYHVPNNTPYIRYFVSVILQFQFYKSMCQAAGHKGPLYKCDFYSSTDAGNKLAEIMKIGSSVPWPETLEKITGCKSMSASALVEYFQPLIDWLKKENENDCFGWGYQWPSTWALPLPRCPAEQPTAKEWLEEYNQNASRMYNYKLRMQWNFETNITDENQKLADSATTKKIVFDQQSAESAKQFDVSKIFDYTTKRQMRKVQDVGLKLNLDETKKFTSLISTMTSIFSTGYICKQNMKNCTNDPSSQWRSNPTLITIMAESRDYDLLRYVWEKWRNATGAKMLSLYKEYVQLGNKGAKAAGYHDMGDWWRSSYEDPRFQADTEKLWRQLLPLYEQLHAYVRRKLIETYPGRFQTSAVPAHIFGNMWAQQWNNLYNMTVPHPDVPTVDVTDEMEAKGYDAMEMFRTSERFFASIGMANMTESFWNLSILTKPKGREVVCHATAEDFFNGKDFGIKMCTKVTMEDLITIHHEMGHIQYFMAYSKQPIKFRDGANAGMVIFSAIGVILTLTGTIEIMHWIRFV